MISIPEPISRIVLSSLLRRINAIHAYSEPDLQRIRRGGTTPLFEAHPRLTAFVPWRPLGVFPTPVEELPRPDGIESGIRLFVKRDDCSSPLYGGNKVRKLEHSIADAELRGSRTIITLGGLGSNHALATAVHARSLGFGVDLVLFDQPITEYVRANLGGLLAAGARIHYAGSQVRAFVIARGLRARRLHEGRRPYFVMVGGTSRLGCMGHVNAGFELAAQVAVGKIPEPDALFVALGTCGTAAGLIVGLRLAGLRTRIVAVRVADPIAANPVVLQFLAQDLADYLHRIDASIPRVEISPHDFQVVRHHFGTGYGRPTPAGNAALKWAAPRLSLEPTYTGKTLACCLEALGEWKKEGTVLFWNSFNSAPVERPTTWDALPPEISDLMVANDHPHAASRIK